MSGFYSKQITIKLEIKDLLTVGIDEVECEQIDISELISSINTSNSGQATQKTMSPEVALEKAGTDSIQDLYQSDGRAASKQGQQCGSGRDAGLYGSEADLKKSDLQEGAPAPQGGPRGAKRAAAPAPAGGGAAL